MAHGLRDKPMALVPLGGAMMQFRPTFGPGLLQALAQEIGEETMVAIPMPVVVEREQEQVRALEVFEHPLTLELAGEGVAQRAGEAIQNRGLAQEGLYVGRLLLENLLSQIVHDVTVAAGERADERQAVGAIPHGQRGQL